MPKLVESEKNIAEVTGKRLLHLRTHYGLSQSELAKKLKCSQGSVSEWESGQKLIPTVFMYRLCRIFKISLDFFDPNIPGIEKMFPTEE
jgi:transcriptional regulator with XRE-family HTH domain